MIKYEVRRISLLRHKAARSSQNSSPRVFQALWVASFPFLTGIEVSVGGFTPAFSFWPVVGVVEPLSLSSTRGYSNEIKKVLDLH